MRVDYDHNAGQSNGMDRYPDYDFDRFMSGASGKLIIQNNGKLALTGEVFDGHGAYPFEAHIDTGCTFGLVLQRELADAVCAPVVSSSSAVSIGAGSGNVTGLHRTVSLRFGGIEIRNYQAFVPEKPITRNLVGVKLLQDAGLLLLIDFHAGKTKGGLVSSDRRFARAFGKIMHCIGSHGVDVPRASDPCPVCRATGE